MDEKIEIVVDEYEELPSGTRRRVIEVPIFTAADKMRLEAMQKKVDMLAETVMEDKMRIGAMLKKVDMFTEALPEDKTSEVLIEIKNSLATLFSSIQNNEKKIILFLDRIIANMENTSISASSLHDIRSMLEERINLLDSKMDEKSYTADSTINYLKGSIIETNEKVSAYSEFMDKKINALVETMNEKFDAHMASLNSQLDNLSLQVSEPLNDVSMRLEVMKKEVDSLKRLRTRIVVHVPTNALEMLMEAKKRIKSKRVQKKNQPEKKRLIDRITGIEDNVLDIFILSAIGKKKLSLPQIKKDVPASETKIRKRVKGLTAAGKVVQGRRSKKDRTKVYSVV